MTLLSTTLGPIRNTIHRDPNAPSVINSYGVLLTSIKEAGLLRRTRFFYFGLFAILVVALGGLTTGFIIIGNSWFQLLIAAGLGILLTQFAFITHEASHRQVFDSGRANDRVGRVLAAGVVGISYNWWMTKHTRHHANPNTIGKDPDIDYDTIAFLEEDAAKQRGLMRWIAQRQGYLFFPLLTLEGLNLHYLSIRTLFEKKVRIQGRALELSLIGVRLSAYVAVLFLVLPMGMAFAFLGVQLAVFGVYMGASFAPNHKGMPIIPRDEKVDFLSKQVLTSRNISGFGMGTFMGGLNYQIEHHLFPNMPRPHLARAREMVIAHCEAQGVKYTETTLMRSYGIVIAYLNRVGLAARDPFDCPEVSRYRRP